MGDAGDLCLAYWRGAFGLMSCDRDETQTWRYVPESGRMEFVANDSRGRCIAYAGRGRFEFVDCENERAGGWRFDQ